jgi:hypothetical protein
MNVEQLRHDFDRLADGVVPVPDPYGRLLRRSRRRRLAQAGTVVGTAVAAILALATGGVAVQGTGDRTGDTFAGWPITSDWTRRLIDSPTRGSLAGNSALLGDLVAAIHPLAPQSLARTKVLFAGDVGQNRLAVIANYSDTDATIGEFSGPRNASVEELVRNFRANFAPSETPLMRGMLAPVLTIAGPPGNADAARGWTVVLAPAGCQVATSAAAGSWQPAPTGDWLLAATSGLFYTRVSCAGAVRQQGPTGTVDEVSGIASGNLPVPARGNADPTAVAAAVAAFDRLTQAVGRGDQPHVIWAGQLPDPKTPGQAVLVAGDGASRPVMLQIGSPGKSMVAMAPAGQATPDGEPTMAQSRKEWGLISTGQSDDHGLVAVRLPQRVGAHAELTDRLFVVAPPTAVRVEAIGPNGQVIAQAITSEGLSTLDIGIGRAGSVRALDVGGQPVATSTLAEPANGTRLFGEQLITNW